MAEFEGALAGDDQQGLRALVVHVVALGDGVGDVAVREQVKEVAIGSALKLRQREVHPVEYKAGGAAARGMLEQHLRALCRDCIDAV